MEENEPLSYSDEEVIERIIKLTEGLGDFWSSSNGWAPIKSADLMSKSRLDWQASLARILKVFNTNDIKKEDGGLILAWTTLGSLTEGVLKLFLSVWHTDYEASALKSTLNGYTDKNGDLIDPDILMLEKLRVFFAKEIYPREIREIWKKQGRLDIIDWIFKIQQRRNAIHAYKDRDIGDFDEFFFELKNFLIVMRRLTDTFPYPDEYIYKPTEK
jgi:hypothetical protein